MHERTTIPKRGGGCRNERTLLSALLLLGALFGAVDPAAATARRVFVTSQKGTGNLSTWPQAAGQTGVAAGNAICQTLAENAGLASPGTHLPKFRAWLSDSISDAGCLVRGQTDGLGQCTGPAPDPIGPLYLANGITPFAGALEDLIGQPREIYRGALLDENLDLIPADGSDYYWTGTAANGRKTQDRCNGWTSATSPPFLGTIGRTRAAAEHWTNAYVTLCSSLRRLLCVEAGEGTMSKPRWSPGRLAFVTSTAGTGDLASWAPPGPWDGFAAADAECRARATVAGLPDADGFQALTSESGSSWEERLSGPGAIRRLDNFEVAPSIAALKLGPASNSLHVDEFGRYLRDNVAVWTGSLSDGTPAPATCGDWFFGDSGSYGEIGWASMSRDDSWMSAGIFPCVETAHLYCVGKEVIIFWDGFERTGDTSRWSSTTP